MLVSFLAVLLSVLILAKVLIYMFMPTYITQVTKPFITYVKNHYINAQIITLIALLIIAAIVTSLIGFLNMIVAGWFWTALMTINIIPAYRHITAIAPLTKLAESKDFKADMQLVGGIYIILSVLTILYVIADFI